MVKPVFVINTGNVSSIRASLLRLDVDPVVIAEDNVNDFDIMDQESLWVVPGVGTYEGLMNRLSSIIRRTPSGEFTLKSILIDRIANRCPTLLICVGIQVLAEFSEESPGITGLTCNSADFKGVGCTEIGGEYVDSSGVTKRLCMPQQGWNQIFRLEPVGLVEDGFAYFTNSFGVTPDSKQLEILRDSQWIPTYTNYGVPFLASIQSGNVLATQFHPELSGKYGISLLRRWIHESGSISLTSTFVGKSGLRSYGDAERSAGYKRIIPCLDCKDGKVVKGVKFQDLQDCGDPAEVALLYEQMGADEICMLDVSATPEGRATSLETVQRIRANLSIPLTVGGGVKSVESARTLLEAGADKVAVNSAAARNPSLITELSTAFGRQCVVLAIDAKASENGWEIVTESGTQIWDTSDAINWAKKGEELGAGEILLTSFDQDGTRSGYSIEMLKAVCNAVNVPVIASGGASTADHMRQAFDVGVSACLAASIFHYKTTTPFELKLEIGGSQSVQFRTPHGQAETQDRGRQHCIPSIDILGGEVVQLVSGDPSKPGSRKFGCPFQVMKRFALLGEVAVIDLDAALKTGRTNKEVILQLCRTYPGKCRVGGGIREVSIGLDYLDAGASKIIVGTRAVPEFLKEFPTTRLIAALDQKADKVVVEGWQGSTGDSVVSRIEELRPYVSGFLITFVDNEGRLTGVTDEYRRRVELYKEMAGDLSVIIAGGVTTQADFLALDTIGCEAQIGMSLYTDKITLGQCVTAVLRSDRPDGLYPTVVVDQNDRVLGLVYSSNESIAEALATRRGVYFSRSRQEIWRKGESSGCVQELISVSLDCDRDSLIFRVAQKDGFCHRKGVESCFNEENTGISRLMETLTQRVANPLPGSYSQRLFRDSEMLHAKILEEATELCEAEDLEHVVSECADVLYFALVKLVQKGGSLEMLSKHLDAKSLKVSRRPGNTKPEFHKLIKERDLRYKEEKEAENARTMDATSKKEVLNESPSITLSPPTPDHITGFTHFKSILRSTEELKSYLSTHVSIDPQAIDVAKDLASVIKEEGEPGLRSCMLRFNEIQEEGSPIIIDRSELKEVYENEVSESIRQVLQRSADRIRGFAEAQLACLDTNLTMQIGETGYSAGHSVAAIETVGCYAPCGLYPLPSSILMTCIPARVAGAKTLVLASPCGSKSDETRQLMLSAAYLAGVDKVLLAGGAHGIAALASGVSGVCPPCHAIVGPGNQYVTAAKSLISGQVAIDFLAGPSEVLIIADSSTNPELVAADLLAQAEHDYQARCILITNDTELVGLVDYEISKLLKMVEDEESNFSNAQVAKASLFKNSLAVLVSDMEEAAAMANELAPEHLEIMCEDPTGIAKLCHNYGAIFIGPQAAEVFGDYGFGPNHCLPTGGTSKSFGGLSVFTFLRFRTFLASQQRAGSRSLPATEEIQKDAIALARLEGLEFHAKAAEARLARNHLNDPVLGSNGESSCSNELKWALPKGRIYDNLVKLLRDANYDIRIPERGLRPTVACMPNWNFKLLKARCIAGMLYHGIRDIAALGLDLIEEAGYTTEEIVPILDTKMDKVRIVVAAPLALIAEAKASRRRLNCYDGKSSLNLPISRPLTVATEYPRLTARWIEHVGLKDCKIIVSSGSTEAYPPEDADFIVDNVSTGNTLRANGLEIIDSFFQSSTHLVVSREALNNPRKMAGIKDVKLMLESTLKARSSSFVEFNVIGQGASPDLSVFSTFLPCLGDLTVSSLSHERGVAVKTIMSKDDLPALLPKIMKAGGSDVIVSNVQQILSDKR